VYASHVQLIREQIVRFPFVAVSLWPNRCRMMPSPQVQSSSLAAPGRAWPQVGHVSPVTAAPGILGAHRSFLNFLQSHSQQSVPGR
jgi:hypothetical protein